MMGDLDVPPSRSPWWASISSLFANDVASSPPPSQPPASARENPSAPSSSPDMVVRNRRSWSPPAAAVEWVRRVTSGGRAIALRRQQDAESKRDELGTAPKLPKPDHRKESRPRVPAPPVVLLQSPSRQPLLPPHPPEVFLLPSFHLRSIGRPSSRRRRGPARRGRPTMRGAIGRLRAELEQHK